jgi:hypothetical protein
MNLKIPTYKDKLKPVPVPNFTKPPKTNSPITETSPVKPGTPVTDSQTGKTVPRPTSTPSKKKSSSRSTPSQAPSQPSPRPDEVVQSQPKPVEQPVRAEDKQKVQDLTTQRDLIADRIRSQGATQDRLERFYSVDFQRQRALRGEDFTDSDRDAVRLAAEKELRRQQIWYDTRDQLVRDVQPELNRLFAERESERSPVIGGEIQPDTNRSFATTISSERARLEQKGVGGKFLSGGLAVVELGVDVGRGAGSLIKTGTVGAIDRFEIKQGPLGPFPSIVPKQYEDVPKLPTFRQLETSADKIGPGLLRDPIKGGVTIVAEIATGVIPISGFKGGRLIKYDIPGNAPGSPQTQIPSTGQPFKIGEEVGTAVFTREGRTASVNVGGGQLNLGGNIAKSPPSVFKPGDFIPIQDSVTGRLKFVPPNSPELKTTVTAPISPGMRSPDSKLRDIYSGPLDAFGQPKNVPTSAEGVSVISNRNIQSQLPNPGVGFKDPVIMRDTYTGATKKVEANLVVDFLSDSNMDFPGRFKVEGRPTNFGPVMKFGDTASTQKPLVDSKGNTLFAMPIPIVTPNMLKQPGLSSVTKTQFNVPEASSGITQPGKSTGTARFEYPSVFGVSTLSAGKASNLGLSVGQTSTSVNKVDISGATTSITDQQLTPMSVTEVGSRTRTASVTSTATRSRSITSLTPVTTLQPVTPVVTPVTPQTPLKPVRPITPTPNYFLRPSVDYSRSRSGRLITSTEKLTARVRGVRTASPGRGFVINPSGRSGGVRFVRAGREVDLGERKKKRKVFDTFSRFNIRLGGL